MAKINRKKYSDDTKIAVLNGGMSSEREVSLRSGKNVFEALKRLGYKNVELVDVDKNVAQKLQEGNFKVAFNALHGKYGEDGCIQGLLELLGIEYTGCGVFSSAACMNKQNTKNILKNFPNIPLIKSVFIRQNENVKEKVQGLNYPMMIKPVSEGSSIGMYKVETPAQLEEFFNKALSCKQDIMIEEYLVGVCATVGVLDDEDKTFATEILEIRPKTEWYDYESKYTAGMTEFILPAELTDDMTKRVKEIAVKAHRACSCSGVSRVDFLIVDDIPYVLEINTSPGMTDLSDLPAQANAMGITYDELVLTILNNAGLNR
ncbi:MAG: D-alanine--D-alanine ligase [Candidatus Gastranaerophilales bacterium]|nr:D-alanine--D-alanine ligase [Candidatus Gastranaerophilales bacterium]